MNIYCTIGLSAIIGFTITYFYNKYTNTKEFNIKMKPDEFKVRIRPELYNELKSHNKLYEMKLVTKRKNRQIMKEQMIKNGLIIKNEFDFHNGNVRAVADGFSRTIS